MTGVADLGVKRELEQRSQRTCGEHVDIAVQILALNRDQKIAGRSGKGEVMIR